MADVETMQMREFGMVVQATNSPDAVRRAESKAQAGLSDFLTGLEENCKTLVIDEARVAYKPQVDAFQRFTGVGWYVVAGSPQMDYFERMFKTPDRTPKTVWGCVKLALQIVRDKFRSEGEWE